MRKLLYLFILQAIISLLVPIPALSGTEATNPQNVLVVHTGGPTVPWFRALHPIVETAIQNGADKRLLFSAEFLDLYKRNDEAYRKLLIDLLRTKYVDTRFDLLVTFGPHALDLILDHKADLFPDVPVVFGRAQPVVPEKAKPFSDVTGVILKPGKNRVESTLELGLALHPNTRKVIVVLGVDGWSRNKEVWARERFKKFESRVEFVWTSGQSMDEILALVESPPKHSFVLYLFLAEDGRGNIFVPTEACRRIAASSSAPVYATFDTLIGTGIVGGHMSRARTHAHAVADLGAKILNGHDPEALPVQTHGFEYVFDWRQIDKWGIKESAIPADSVLHFKTFSLWEQYKRQLLIGAFVILLQLFLIGGLILNRSKLVTSRKIATESEERYRSMIEASPVAIMTIRDGNFVSINSSGIRMLGYSDPDELLGMPALNVVASESQAMITERLRRIDKGESNPFAEATLVRRDGVEFTIESSSVSVTIDGKTTAMVFAKDISQRKEMEMQLKESEERFRAFMNHIPAAIYIKNQNDEHIFGNPAAIETVNLSADEFLGKTTRDLFPSEIADRLIEVDRKVLNEEKTTITEEWIDTKNGKNHWRKDIKFPIELLSGKKLLGGIAIDISDLKRTEIALSEQLAFEDLISRLSATFIHIKASEIDRTIERGLGLVAAFLDVQRSNLFLFAHNNEALHLIYKYTAEGVGKSPKMLYSEQQPWFTQRMRSGKPYCFSNLAELPPEAAAEKAYLKRVGVKSAVVMPLMGAGVSHGGITFSSTRVERQWPDKLMQQLSTVAEVFSNALLRKRAHGVIEQRLDFESLLANLATRLINLDIDETNHFLEVAMEKISELFSLDRSSILQFNEDLSELDRTHMWERDGINPDPHGVPLQVHEKFSSIFHRLQNAETIIFPDTATLSDDEVSAYCQAIGIQSFIMLPLSVGKRKLGAMVFSAIHSNIAFPDDQIKQLSLFGTIVANALDRQRTIRSLEESQQRSRLLAGRILSIQEGERRRLARELHDDLSQRLAVVAISASHARSKLQPVSAEAAEIFQTIKEQLVQISDDAHAISRQLHPSILDDLGLVDAVRNEINAFRGREKIHIDYLTSDIPAKLPKDVALCVFRIIQEGLRNIAKHAKAESASVALTRSAKDITLEISDHGCGFDPKSSRQQPGLGLISIGERVRMVSGTLNIRSSPGQGTRIQVSVPVTSDAKTA